MTIRVWSYGIKPIAIPATQVQLPPGSTKEKRPQKDLQCAFDELDLQGVL